ncbi:unnamed protein product [Phaedon cochleariae]|uniref:NIF3-like protein 1 n=1 Tax=Phaedon cochleariae TaxID=80249 RepID=A0A9P0GUL1_PHACE|nr:unnamed protein product [Phaedon cochleariae]
MLVTRTLVHKNFSKKTFFSSTSKHFLTSQHFVRDTGIRSLNRCSNMGVKLRDIINRLNVMAPLKLAESWDNVGVLVEPDSDKIIETILLTIDLTEDVLEEAIENKAQLIISYHPNIFKSLKTVSQNHWKERIIIKCIRNGIAVFSPHTSWDSVEGGVNDWLGSAFQTQSSKAILKNKEYPDSNIGAGRLLSLAAPITFRKAIDDVKEHIGLSHLRIGVSRHKDLDSLISTVALCAGSGTSVLNGVQADLYLTGEMMHHDVLEATQNGIHVILCNHSDSERGYLEHFQEKLIKSENINVMVSKVDRDCLTIV